MSDDKVSIKFAKKQDMRFISHLDLQRLFSRALRRAGLPVALSAGFSPRPKISFKRALALGQESDDEEVHIVFKERIEPEVFKDMLQRQLPDGIEIREVIWKSGMVR